MIVTLSHGSRVALLSNQPIPLEDCKIGELAWNLSNIYRFGGTSISVAQHSCMVSQIGDGSAYAKLMHDVHEAAVGDISTPVKQALDHLSGGRWAELEAINAAKFRRRYGLPVHLPACVKVADRLAAQIEVGSLFSPEVQRSYRCQGLEPVYHPIHQITHIWTPDESYRQFLSRYREVGGGIP